MIVISSATGLIVSNVGNARKELHLYCKFKLLWICANCGLAARNHYTLSERFGFFHVASYITIYIIFIVKLIYQLAVLLGFVYLFQF